MFWKQSFVALTAVFLAIQGAWPQANPDNAEAAPPEATSGPEAVQEELPDFLLEGDEFTGDEGVWADEFDDGKPSTAWFVYSSDYFTAPDQAAKQDPRTPNTSGQTIYDDPIRAKELEGLLSISGSRSGLSGGSEAAAKYDASDLKRYKVITPDVIRGAFQAELKIALRGKTFKEAQVLFFVREHDWKFGGAHEARVRTTIAFPSDNPADPAEVSYESNWEQEEHSKPQDKVFGLRVESSITLTFRRSQGDNQIQFWTAEDEGEPELRGRLGPYIDTDRVDILVGVQAESVPNQEGILTLDSLTIRGPEVPDVEEGTEDQTLKDYRATNQAEYEEEVKGRFDYSKAALAANRGFTWMHLYGTGTPYPPGLLPLPEVQPQIEGQPNQPFPGPMAFPGPMMMMNTMPMGNESSSMAMGDQSGQYGEMGEGNMGEGMMGMPITPVEPGSEQEKFLHNQLDTQTFPRGDVRYFNEALKKYKEAASLDPKYQTIYSQMQWVRNVAYDRILRIMQIFRARTGDAATTGNNIQMGNRTVKKDFDSMVGSESTTMGGEMGGLGGSPFGGSAMGGGAMMMQSMAGGGAMGGGMNMGSMGGGMMGGGMMGDMTGGGSATLAPGQSQWDPRIRLFEGHLSPEVKALVVNLPESSAIQMIYGYLGIESEIQRPVDVVGRIPFLFTEDWMTIPLTIYIPDISMEVMQRIIAANPDLLVQMQMSQMGGMGGGMGQMGGMGGGMGNMGSMGGMGGGMGQMGGMGGDMGSMFGGSSSFGQMGGMGGGSGSMFSGSSFGDMGGMGGGMGGMGGGMGNMGSMGGMGGGMGSMGGMGGGMGQMGGMGGMGGGMGQTGMMFQSIPGQPNPLADLYYKMGRGYSVVEYYGASYLVSDQIITDDQGRIKPKETAQKAFAWCRDMPGLIDVAAEILDPNKHGSVIIEWDMDLNALQNILNVPRSDTKPEGELAPPDVLYEESKIPLLVNLENPDIPRKFTMADYFGWQLGPEEGFREGELPNHLGAFDSPHLRLSAGASNVQPQP